MIKIALLNTEIEVTINNNNFPEDSYLFKFYSLLRIWKFLLYLINLYITYKEAAIITKPITKVSCLLLSIKLQNFT